MQSIRSSLVARRTYCRPLPNGKYETWEQVVLRVIDHQRWLWERALGRPLNITEEGELTDLSKLMYERKALPSGRILWMGGTEQAARTEISMFNCAHLVVRDVYSAVDAFYLLLNGCGVGFTPQAGMLNGFVNKPEIWTVNSKNEHTQGNPLNAEHFYKEDDGKSVWRLRVGDSGKAWAKALGKILAMKTPVDKILLDFTEIRKPGVRLSGYGWLSSGDAQISDAFVKICKILKERSDELLTEIDILDIINLAGTTLTSRRSAEIALMDSRHELAEAFSYAKRDHYETAPWRSQSNNSLVFYARPTKLEIRGIFAAMVEAGGSEPGLYNGAAAKRRAPWFAGTNPCGEILLADGGLCNLAELNLAAFRIKSMDDEGALYDAIRLISRANYRQTCVNLKDGVLSDRWHETQEFLRLCGVGLTGITQWLDSLPARYDPADYLDTLRSEATEAADDMAEELCSPRAKAVTTVKPSGTLGKLMDCSEGLHRPVGRYVFNWIKFDANDTTVKSLVDANYLVIPDPYSKNNVLACIPVDNGPGAWQQIGDSYYNNESAITQLDRYKLLMDNYVDHNASVTISYDVAEVPEIVEWLYENWDSYVGVSFILRQDPTKTAKDLGYPYLPQEVVGEAMFYGYVNQLKNIEFDGGDLLDIDECEGGACPVR